MSREAYEKQGLVFLKNFFIEHNTKFYKMRETSLPDYLIVTPRKALFCEIKVSQKIVNIRSFSKGQTETIKELADKGYVVLLLFRDSVHKKWKLVFADVFVRTKGHVVLEYSL